ncbi:MAG: bifunctional 4-hydroxy-2-oxoglutarate aldolase/2-dehydro-3-deoxy-phosphogluconate aldolase [Hyphomonadaceae bacterium]|nr:bifunctional 4-hydroxy-2-oxoglutarate aldolase/2-dehydro-3-deoxy-phosphogluconate aldolase [Hyphomonadaceae bacterium]
MDWTRILEALDACPIVPVLSIPEPEHAEPLALALAEGGITVSEITLRTPAGLGAIAAFKSACPGMVTGAGTILNSQDLTTAVSAGADFIVSPGFDGSLLSKLATCPVPVMPGIATPSEAIAARTAGIKRVKLFPASLVGGAPMIKALGGPLQDMGFMPTGGVTLDTLADYLSLPNVYAVGGTWIAKPEHLVAGDWDGIAARAADALKAAKAIRS